MSASLPCLLVVDASKHGRALLRDMLNRSLGILALQEAADADAARAALAGGQIGAALIDVGEDAHASIDLVRAIRHGLTAAPANLPVIALAARPTRRTIEKLRDLGINEILGRPVSVSALSERLRALRERPREWIVADGYSGPDRRRRTLPHPGPDRRGDGAILLEEDAGDEASPPKRGD